MMTDAAENDPENLAFDPQNLVKIANTVMPFGKYKGLRLLDLPEPYLLWFAKQGFPNGSLGSLMELTLALKIEGLESLARPLIDSGDEDTATAKIRD